jgi:hypothetical protein
VAISVGTGSISILSLSIQPAGFSVHCADRNKELSRKEKEGGVCFMINCSWCDCDNIQKLKSFCSPELEFLTIKHRPYYLPIELSSVIVFSPSSQYHLDGIPSRILRACTDQLAGVFIDIFNLSLSRSAVPICFKMSTIVPVPKKAKVTELNHYHSEALTSVIVKCFERQVKNHITSNLPDTLDPLQFPYRPNRSTDDAIAIALHTALSHLDKRNIYVRMLFIDYSSAFNTIVPSNLIIKLGPWVSTLPCATGSWTS